MDNFLQIFIFIVIGVVFIWLGYFLFFGTMSPLYPYLPWGKNKKIKDDPPLKGKPGDPQICPVCSMVMKKGELVKTEAFPSDTSGIDRIMHVYGCHYCLDEDFPRFCPVCRTKISIQDFLFARMFERKNNVKNHVHILGCMKCRKKQ